MGFLTVDQSKSWMVAAHLQKRKLLISVNVLAGMSIFFFGTFHRPLSTSLPHSEASQSNALIKSQVMIKA